MEEESLATHTALPELWRGPGWPRVEGPALWAAALRAGTRPAVRACSRVGGRVGSVAVWRLLGCEDVACVQEGPTWGAFPFQ